MTDAKKPSEVAQTISSYSFRGYVVNPAADDALEFYEQHYTPLEFRDLAGNKQVVLGSKPFKCRFCGGEPPTHTFRKRAHAISELLGNKIIKSLYECDACNQRFRDFEDDLAKMTHPSRSLGGVVGKNGIPSLVAANGKSGRMRSNSSGLHFSHDVGSDSLADDPATKTLTFEYMAQPYRPLGAYKALCKSAYTLLPQGELIHFEHLRLWLLQADLESARVYGTGSHICHSTVLTAFRPFRVPIICLLRRKEQTDTPYMSFFIATGNFSYQIFLPCPSMDGHLPGKALTTPPYPHIFQLQPWRTPGQTWAKTLELSSPERTSEKSGILKFTYGSVAKLD
jgi:hypothetical protein